jgi:hypothetical protein
VRAAGTHMAVHMLLVELETLKTLLDEQQ